MAASSEAGVDGPAVKGVTFVVNDDEPIDDFVLNMPRWAPDKVPVQGSSIPQMAQHGDLVCPDSCTEHPEVLLNQVHGHGFISACCKAFDHHLPLSLRPEQLWILVLQGMARHVAANAEALRSQFVSHDGQKELVVLRDEWAGRLGDAGLDWATVVAEFSGQIDENTVDGVAELIATDFSTTTPTEQVVGQVTVMDMMQQFFGYKVLTRCGFPSITLEGDPADWRRLVEKTHALVSTKCTPERAKQWLPALMSVLERVAAQAENPKKVDVTFWQSMCKRGGSRGSGGYTWINGWVNVFFPYLTPRKNNGPPRESPFCVPYTPDIGYAQEPQGRSTYYGGWRIPLESAKGPALNEFPGGMACAPVVWDYLGRSIPLSFRAGFVGAAQRSDGTIYPAVGWAIVTEGPKRKGEGTTSGSSKKRKPDA